MNALAVLVVLGLTASALATECGPLQKIKVKHQWADVYDVGHDREAFATAVWQHYFHDNPDRSLFEHVNGNNIYSGEFRAHMVRVFAGLDILISVIDDDAVFNQATAHYAAFHKQFGSIPFEQFGKTVIYMLPDFVHGIFDHDAWTACYGYIASKMQ